MTQKYESIEEATDRLLEGNTIVNPAYNNPELSKEIAGDFIIEDLKASKILRTESEVERLEKIITNYYGKTDLASQIIKIQPLYFDGNKIWWCWNSQEFKWEIIDETDVLLFVRKLSRYNTIKSKEKAEIIEALKQEARVNQPKPVKKTWIQFRDKIFDINTGKTFPATSKYFITNPIPYELHPDKFEDTPVMDKIFEEWVGKDYVPLLYEILAYCLLPNYPIHRIFCFIGSGMNGKSCFLNLLKKFIGTFNVCTTELDRLLSSRFEVTKLHKKLVCQMGETNFDEINQTSLLKKLSGGDLIGFEYKNKNPFEDINYAKIIIATNNLPTTTDKTIGFYRRWLIIDFPFKFSEKKDILADIPEEEYSSLALKCCTILKDLLTKREFIKEGSVEYRMERYESKSNFLDKFINLFVDMDNPDNFITKNDFRTKFSEWCIEHRHRKISDTSLGRDMKERGIETGRKEFSWMNDGKGGVARVWLGLRWKE